MVDFNSKEGVDKFVSEKLSDMLNDINETYGPILMEELIDRIKFTINEFNEEVSSAFNELKAKEENRQKMYMMIKSGDIPDKSENLGEEVSKEWKDKIDKLES